MTGEARTSSFDTGAAPGGHDPVFPPSRTDCVSVFRSTPRLSGTTRVAQQLFPRCWPLRWKTLSCLDSKTPGRQRLGSIIRLRFSEGAS